MNADRSQEYFINLDGARWRAVRVVQYVHIGGEYTQPHGLPWQPAKVFCYNAYEGLTLPQSWEYLDALENALVQAAEWEAERKQQEREAQS